MSRTNMQQIACGTAISAVFLGVIGFPLGALAQQNNERGGMWAQMRLTQRLLTRDTSSPEITADGTTNQAVTDLDVSFSTETRTEALTLDFGGEFRVIDGPATSGTEAQFTSPEVRLTYSQSAASASVSAIVKAQQVDLADVSTLGLSSDNEILPGDVLDLTDGGTRRQLSFNGRLTLRDDAPFGLEFGLFANDISYAELPDGSGLSDSTTARTDMTGRFDLSPVLQIRLGVHYTYTQTEDAPQTDRYGLSSTTTLARPNGEISVSASHADGDGGAVNTAEVGRRFVLPHTEAAFAMGMASAADDNIYLTGRAQFDHAFADNSRFGPLTAAVARDVSFSTGNDQEVVNAVSLAGSYALSPRARLRLSTEWGFAEEVLTGDTITLSEAALSLGYELSRDWRANAGLRAKRSAPSGSENTESTTLSLGVTRLFDVRF